MNAETPPLAKLIAAAPLLLIRPKFDTSGEDWQKGIQSIFAFRFLYQNDANRLLFWARIAIVAVAALGGAITFLWARDLFGPAAGLFAAILYSFSPNLLAHGMLVATDVPVAVFTILTLYLFWKRSIDSGWRSDAAIGVALGAAMTTKFSAAVLPLILIVFSIARFRRAALKSLLVMAAVAVFVIEAAYLFSASPLIYFRNVTLVNSYNVQNYPVYLFGQVKAGGWWYYFLAAFAVKATAPVLILIALTIIRSIQGFRDRWGEMLLLATIGVFAAGTSAGAAQAGIRYMLPVFPLLFVWVSRIVPEFLRLRAGKVVLAVLLAWHFGSSARAFPNYIPYFNELVGGAARGAEFLDDSNVDWGQGLKQAAEYVRAHRLDRATVYSFSPFDFPQYYGLNPNLRQAEVGSRLLGRVPAPGTYIISAHRVIRMRQADPAWKKYKPVDRIGESLWVYQF